jgi:hypothetical protein
MIAGRHGIIDHRGEGGARTLDPSAPVIDATAALGGAPSRETYPINSHARPEVRDARGTRRSRPSAYVSKENNGGLFRYKYVLEWNNSIFWRSGVAPPAYMR